MNLPAHRAIVGKHFRKKKRKRHRIRNKENESNTKDRQSNTGLATGARPKLMTCYAKRDSGLATYMEVMCYGFKFINIRIGEKWIRNYARIFCPLTFRLQTWTKLQLWSVHPFCPLKFRQIILPSGLKFANAARGGRLGCGFVDVLMCGLTLMMGCNMTVWRWVESKPHGNP